MEFSDFWDIKKTAEGLRSKDDHVEGHFEGDHEYCSLSKCSVAKNCYENNYHADCNPASCEIRAMHDRGDHAECEVNNKHTRATMAWCKPTEEVRQWLESEDAQKFYDEHNNGEIPDVWEPDSPIETDPDPTDASIIYSMPKFVPPKRSR